MLKCLGLFGLMVEDSASPKRGGRSCINEKNYWKGSHFGAWM